MSLTRREQAEYDRLRAKRRAAAARDDGGSRRRPTEADDDDGVFVFSGRHAENFLDRMFGADNDDGPDEDDDDGPDEDDDDGPDEDPDPPAGNRFFRGRR